MNPGSVFISSQTGVRFRLFLASIIVLRLIAFEDRSVRLFLKASGRLVKVDSIFPTIGAILYFYD